MGFVEQFVNGGAPGIAADILNEPFFVKTVSYDATNNYLTCTILPGSVDWGGGVRDLLTGTTTFNGEGIESQQLSAGLTSGSVYTSLSVGGGAAQAYVSGQKITLLSGVNRQVVTVAGAVTLGTNPIPVNSFTANFSYPIGTSLRFIFASTTYYVLYVKGGTFFLGPAAGIPGLHQFRLASVATAATIGNPPTVTDLRGLVTALPYFGSAALAAKPTISNVVGSMGSCVITSGNDQAGILQAHTSAGGPTGRVFDVAFAVSLPAAPRAVLLSPANADAAQSMTAYVDSGSLTAGGWSFYYGNSYVNRLADWHYVVMP